MIHVIMGLKGSGKTKKMIDSINEALKSAHGDVVCIEYGKKLTYDINYRVRLVDSKEYGINSLGMLKGLLSGLHAGNFDITHVYIDNLYKTIGTDRAAGEALIATMKSGIELYREVQNNPSFKKWLFDSVFNATYIADNGNRV